MDQSPGLSAEALQVPLLTPPPCSAACKALETRPDRLDKIMSLLAQDGDFSGPDLENARLVVQQLEPVEREGLQPALPDEILAKHQRRPAEEAAMYTKFGIDAKVPHCRECGGKCCKVHPSTSEGNLIVKPFAEWLEAKASGMNMSHLEVVGVTYEGMLHVSCSNSLDDCTGCGPNENAGKEPGVKPEDCVLYPWFPQINERGEVEMWVADNRFATCGKSPKCIAPFDAKLAHLPVVVARFAAMLEEHPSFKDAYTNAIEGMVGYRRFNPAPLRGLAPCKIQKILAVGMNLALEEARKRLEEAGALEPQIKMIMQQYTRDLSRKVGVAQNLVGRFYYGSNPKGISYGWAGA